MADSPLASSSLRSANVSSVKIERRSSLTVKDKKTLAIAKVVMPIVRAT